MDEIILRRPDGTFLASGNPRGRPKQLQHVVELARTNTEMAITTLREIAANPASSDAARVSAASVILDRAWGRPMNSLDLSLNKNEETPTLDLSSLSKDEIEMLGDLLERCQPKNLEDNG